MSNSSKLRECNLGQWNEHLTFSPKLDRKNYSLQNVLTPTKRTETQPWLSISSFWGLFGLVKIVNRVQSVNGAGPSTWCHTINRNRKKLTLHWQQLTQRLIRSEYFVFTYLEGLQWVALKYMAMKRTIRYLNESWRLHPLLPCTDSSHQLLISVGTRLPIQMFFLFSPLPSLSWLWNFCRFLTPSFLAIIMSCSWVYL